MSKSPDPQAGGKRLLHILSAGAALTLLVGGSGVYFVSHRISALQAAAAAKETEVGSSEQIARRFQTTQDTYNATLARTQYLETSVSAKAYVPTLLQQLQTLATATHLTVSAVRPGPITVPGSAAGTAAPAGAAAPADASADTTVKRTPRPPYDTMDIAVDVTGSYPSTAAFLYGLTRFPKIVAVTAVQMHPAAPIAGAAGAAPAGPSGVTTSLHLTAFVFHETPSTVPSTSTADAPYRPFSLPALPQAPGGSVVSDAAGHAAARAIGATRAENDRAQVGISTL